LARSDFFLVSGGGGIAALLASDPIEALVKPSSSSKAAAWAC